MRKIYTRRDEIKKQKRNTLIISVILIVVISLSVFGIVANSFGSEQEGQNIIYNGYLFSPSGNSWVLQEGDFQFIFLNNPNLLENITFESNELKLLSSYVQQVLYLSSEDSTVSYQIYQNLGIFLTRVQSACLDEDKEDCQEDFPIKNCTDNFIIIRESDSNRIFQQDNCVFIEGQKQDLNKLTDIFLLKVMGIKD